MEEQRQKQRDEGMNDLFHFVREISSSLGELAARFKLHMDTEEAHYVKTEARLQALEKKLDNVIGDVQSMTVLYKAFPPLDDGTPDISGHYIDHFTRKEEAEGKKKFWENIKEDMLENLVKASIVAIFVLLGLGVLSWLQLHFGITFK